MCADGQPSADLEANEAFTQQPTPYPKASSMLKKQK